jgi:hypothetical protein
VGRPAQRSQGSILENQFRHPRLDLHGGRLTEIQEPLPDPRETYTAPAREEEHRAAGSPSTRPRWTETRESTSSTKGRHQHHHTTTTENNTQPTIRTRPGHPESSRSKDFSPEHWIEWNRRALCLYVSLRDRVQGKGIHLRSQGRVCYREEGRELRSLNEEAERTELRLPPPPTSARPPAPLRLCGLSPRHLVPRPYCPLVGPLGLRAL